MADVTIDSAVETVLHGRANRGGPFWKDTNTAYIIYTDADASLVWSKTTDGGTNWSAANTLVAADVMAYDCYADWQTSGDSGTKIHIVCSETTGNTVSYIYLDTADDSEGSLDTIEAVGGTGSLYSTNTRGYHHVSITKTRGGNLAVALRYADSTPTIYDAFYTSPDGDTWTERTNVMEGVSYDYALLFPANLADSNDLWCLYWDYDASEISLKTFDNSDGAGGSWSETSVSGSMTSHQGYIQFSGEIRHSDGHLIMAAWTQYDNAAADLKTWDITDAGTITAKTNIITDEAENFLASVFINQSNNYIYVAYVQGSSAGSTVSTVYNYSDDGMATWEGETAMQADAEDDERWVSCGAVKTSGGGKFMGIWMNDDLNDIFCNTDNAVAIAASGGGWTNIAKINGVTATDLAKVDGISVDDIAKICGVAV